MSSRALHPGSGGVSCACRHLLPVVLIVAIWLTGCGTASDVPRLVLGTTHTLEDSGLLDTLVAVWRREHGDEYRLSTVVAGSGEILTLARRGDIDVVLAHSPEDEQDLLASRHAESRAPVMYNDFVIAGPASDPARVRQAESARDAFVRIASGPQPFVSRGDRSGTHRRELALLKAGAVTPGWRGYVEAGTGMADAMRVAAAREAYILADRATFERFGRELDLVALLEGDPVLLNQYSVLVVQSSGAIEGARMFADWIRGSAIQRLIAEYRVTGVQRAVYFSAAAGAP